jgi:integrase
MKLTNPTIRSLELPPGVKEKTFFDDDVPGFGVRLRDSGSRSFVLQYKFGGKNRRMALGAVTARDLGKARSDAKNLLARIRLGEDPFLTKLGARSKAAQTFGGKLLDDHLEAKKAELTPRWFRQVTTLLRSYAKPLHGYPVRGIDRETVAGLVTEIARKHGTGQGNRFRAVLSAYFTWLIGAGKTDSNPVIGSNKPAEEKMRERLLSDAELAQIWRHAGDDQFGDIVRLLILTGCRRSEIGGLRWDEIDFDEALITLPPSRVKNKREFEIPLSPAAMQILKHQPMREGRECVFGYGAAGYQGWNKSKAELDKRLAVAGARMKGDWVLHDFRRVISTTMHDRLEIPPHVVEAVLHHVSGRLSRTYNKSKYREQKRQALQKWDAHVGDLTSGKGALKEVA